MFHSDTSIVFLLSMKKVAAVSFLGPSGPTGGGGRGEGGCGCMRYNDLG